MNPYRQLAKTTLHAIDQLAEPEEREAALSAILAQAVTKSQDAWRANVQSLEMPCTFDRYEIEHLDNSPHYMQIELAKRLGLAILQNDSICSLSREQSDTDVRFTATVALVPKAYWGS